MKSFRNIVNKLAKLAETPDESSKEPVSDVVRAAILETGYEMALRGERTDEAEGRLENLQELVNAAVDYDEQGIEGLREFIDHSALVSDQDDYKRDAPVIIMTAHSAKVSVSLAVIVDSKRSVSTFAASIALRWKRNDGLLMSR